MPKMGTMAGTGTAVPEQEMSSLMGTARKAIADMGSARALREMLSGLGAAGGGSNSGDSSMLGGIGQLIGGMGTAFKGMSETQTALFSSLLGKNQGGGGGDQNQMLMFLLLMQVMVGASEKSEGAMARVLETMDRTWQQRYEDLERRSGPSQADSITQQLTAQMLGETMQRLRQPPADPVDVLANARERLQKLGVNGGGLFGLGAPDQYTEGYLRNRELDVQLQKTMAEFTAQGQQRQATADLVKAIGEHGPNLMQTLTVSVIQTLAALGMVPTVQPGVGTAQIGAPAAAQYSDEERAQARALLAGGGAAA